MPSIWVHRSSLALFMLGACYRSRTTDSSRDIGGCQFAGMALQSPITCARRRQRPSDRQLVLRQVRREGWICHWSGASAEPGYYNKLDVTLLSPAMAKERSLSCSGGRCVKTYETYRPASSLDVNVTFMLPSPPTDTFPLVTSR